MLSTSNAEIIIDSLKNVIENGQSFASLAERFSEDKGSAKNGGNLGWFTEGTMVKEFNDACFRSIKGELVIVNTQFGTHLIEILDNSKPTRKYKIAYLDRQITYSNSTYQNIFANAGKFAAENTNYEQFDASVQRKLIQKSC